MRSGAMWRAILVGSIVVLPALAVANAGADSAADSAAIVALASGISYGVPESPAFELLPEKPDKVTHASTPNDFQAGLNSWLDGAKLRVGVAIDSRPFILAAGTPGEYLRSRIHQIAFRTVLAAGTSATASGSSDIVTAVGIRIPLIDHGDSRADAPFNEDLIKRMNTALKDLGQPALRASFADTKARIERASESDDVQKVRDDFAAKHWNALRLELGTAGSVTSQEGALSPTSQQSRQGGAWVAASGPWWRNCGFGQFDVVGKSIWSRAVADSDQSEQRLAGLRLRSFWNKAASISIEAGHFWSRHAKDSARDEEWNHYAAVVEWSVTQFNGWIGVGYGGDTSHRSRKGDQISLRYAFYRKPILRKS